MFDLAKIRITGFEVVDVRFPTSRTLDGSDAMNLDPDYSAAYVVLETSSSLAGHGLTFTIGRGNDVCCRVVGMLAGMLVGTDLGKLAADPAGFWYLLTGDSQIRWLGPEKGVVHLAAAAVVNAVWDLLAKASGKPLWRLLSSMTPEQLVAIIPFRYITDALTPAEALEILRRADAPGARESRIERLESAGYPAYTTSAGWLGYSDEKIRGLVRDALAAGWDAFKMKVGRDLGDDLRRAELIRREIGPERRLMMDANQVWDVGQAVEWMRELARFDPLWIEEPTSPDDIIGHSAIARAVAPIGVATGEHCHNRVMFKQFMQAGAMSFCQIDSCRMAGVNEIVAVLLMAAKFGVPVCPHAGGVGLCEYVPHLSMFDFVAVSGAIDGGRMIEYVDHLHEHFVDPVRVGRGVYLTPEASGYGIEMKRESLERFAYPEGAAWSAESATAVPGEGN